MVPDRLNHRIRLVTLLLSCLALVTACDRGPEPVEGFILPEGDVARGQEVFATTGCRYCHTIAGLDLPPFEAEAVLDIELGGKVQRVRDYGDLLNSIVNPDHTISGVHAAKLKKEEWPEGQSPMPVFNDVLTVTELIDLTAFLHSRYEQLLPEYRGYHYVP